MSKKFPFRGPFDKQHGKPTETLLESGQQQIYKNYWSPVNVIELEKVSFSARQNLKTVFKHIGCWW